MDRGLWTNMETDKNLKVGYVVSVQGPVVDVKFPKAEHIPFTAES